MNVRIAVVAAGLVCFGAGLAASQGQTPQDRIAAALARARAAGIPAALLESKIAEGEAKGVAADRIAAAVERREAALERASKVLQGLAGAGADDLVVAADALQSGVSEVVLLTIAETAPQDRRVVAIAALGYLVQNGVVPEQALQRVQDALSRGPEALMNLPAAAGMGRGSGPPDAQSPGGRQAGPPPGVPAPGQAPQAGRPGGPGGPPVTPPTGRGGGGF